MGLLAGSASSVVNYLLLGVMIRSLTSGKAFLAIQSYVIRVLLYLIASFLIVNLGKEAIITISMSIIAISLSIFIVYGIGAILRKDK